MSAARFGGSHTDEEADSLDVAAVRDLIWTRPGRPKGKSCDSASRLRLHTQKIIKNDRCGIVRLSKIAHMSRKQDLAAGNMLSEIQAA